MSRSTRFFVVLFLARFVPAAAGTQSVSDSVQAKTPLRIPRVHEAALKADGVMDEPFWAEALVVPADIEVRPGENIPAPVKTEAYLVYDETAIYAGFKCFDPDPSAIRARLCDRDAIWNDDWILILFDTFNDQRRTYDFTCNPLGIQGDMIESTTGGGDDWDAIWESSGRVTQDGYVVEMAIPFRALGFQRADEDQIWGFDVVRSLPRSVRHHIGAFPRDRNNNCYMCQSLKLIGFAGATPGRNIELAPTVSAVLTQERKDGTSGPFIEKEKRMDPGFTAKWGFTPNLTAGVTANPDFSNVEADALQLDINTQFALYYSEKRPFFLEGADFFQTPFSLVYTRTLADPDWGVKVTGKEGRHAVGFYTVRDNLTNFLFPGAEGSDSGTRKEGSQGTVLRYRTDVGKNSNIGLVMTERRSGGYGNSVAGVDGNVKFTQKDQLTFQVTGSSTDYPDTIASEYGQRRDAFRASAVHLYYGHSTRTWEAYQFFRRVEPGFRADLGFITQAGFTYSETGGSLISRRDPGSWYNWLSLYGSVDQKYDWNGTALHRAVTSRVNYQGPLQSSAGVYGEIGRNRYLGRSFRANWVNGWAFLRPSGFAAFQVSGRFGDLIDYENCRPGRNGNLGLWMELRLGRHLQTEIEHNRDRLDVDGGRLYTAHIERLRIMYQFSKRLFLRSVSSTGNIRKTPCSIPTRKRYRKPKVSSPRFCCPIKSIRRPFSFSGIRTIPTATARFPCCRPTAPYSRRSGTPLSCEADAGRSEPLRRTADDGNSADLPKAEGPPPEVRF